MGGRAILDKLDELINLTDKILETSPINEDERANLSVRIIDFLRNSKLMAEDQYITKINDRIPAPILMVREDYVRKTKNMKNILISLKDRVELEENNEDEIFRRNPHAGLKLAEFNWGGLHKSISAVSKSKFEDGHYADAVESAFKSVNSRVKETYKKRRKDEKDGVELMQRAFSLTDPVIVLEDLSTVSGRDVQLGYMNLFSGAMLGIRNPTAHDNIEIDPKIAFHCVYLASLLMYKLDSEMTA